jgi:HPt (histidine-containing phosphotransfer) domain-containing protein
MPTGSLCASGEIVVRLDRMVADLLPGFMESCVRSASALRRAAEESEWAAARMIGHTLHGAGGGYGLYEVSNIGREMEIAAQRRDAPALRRLGERLADYLARMKPVFE